MIDYATAISATKSVIKYAYENGYHEHGYDLVHAIESEVMDLRRHRDELALAIEIAGMDISPCGKCCLPVVCIPDGLPMCQRCAEEEGRGN